MRKLIWLFAITGILIITSCGDEKKDKERITIGDDNKLKKISTEAEAKPNSSVDSVGEEEKMVEVQLTGNDQMKYNLKEIKVKKGQKVRLVLKHVGQLPVDVMGHNFVLLKQGADLEDFAQRAAGAKENNYIPSDTDKVIIHTKMIGGGEQTTVAFEAPAPGTYTFICSFPGHYMQMQGKFIVE
jgi:azurin